jgi:predicted ATPase/class 3 adenylate cyclase
MTQELPEGTVTILFTDVEGSTALTARKGDEAARALLRAHEEVVRNQVNAHGGHEVKAMGDGFMVAFASARKAVACAAGIQRALVEHNRGRPAGDQLGVRIGLNTGEVIREQADLFGEAVNAAARVAGKAKGAQILVSETVKGVVGRLHDTPLVDRGRFRLKGFPERWRLFEVVWQEEMPVTGGPVLVERTPFVGREAERLQLRNLLDQAARGQGALVMIGGEPGVGKTRLAEELMDEARQRNMTALIGHCYEMEGAPPYIPFVEILEAAVGLFPLEALRSTMGESAPDVARLLPELRRLFPDIPNPVELPPEQERRVLFNGLREFIARAGRAQPLLLVLDDLHWADDATMLLVQHVAQGLQGMPVLILGTYRDVELDVARPLARVLDELVRQRLAHDMSVKRLPEDGVAAMLRSLSGREPPATLVQAIYGETEGNAFFVEEVFKYLAEEGRLFDPSGKGFRPDFSIGELEVPRGVRLVISRRLERVSEECRRVLTTAAVIGRGFSFQLLEALGDVEADALLDAVDEAERAHLIASTADDGAQTGARMGEARFVFAHELIRQTLVSGVSLPRRQRLHLRVAEAMERVYARDLEEHAADLAHHLYQAGAAADPEKTVRYLKLAGERAVATVAFEEGTRLYQMALQAMDLQEKPDEALRCELLIALGDIQMMAGDPVAARESLQRAAAIARDRGLPELLVQAAVGCAGMFALEDQARADLVEEALATLGEEDSAIRAKALACLAASLRYTGAPERRVSLTQQAIEMARRLGDKETLALVLLGALAALGGPENVEECLAMATELIGLAGEAGDKEKALYGHCNRHTALLELGDTVGAEPDFEAHARLAEETRQHAQMWHTVALRAMRALLAGSLEEAEQLAQQALAMGQETKFSLALLGFGVQMFAIRREQGRLGEMESVWRGAAEQNPDIPAVRAGLAFLYTDLGREAEARAEFEGLAADDFAGLPRDENWLTGVAHLAQVCAFLGDAGRAAVLYRSLLPYAGRHIFPAGNFSYIGSVSGHLALLATTMGQWEEAAQHFEEALKMSVQMGARPYLAHTQRDYARMLIARDVPGDRDKAFRLLTEAIAMYREIGMPKHLETAEALLRQV